MTAQPDEPTLADVQRQYPNWHCSRGISGLYYARRYYARRAGTPPGERAQATGEDPLDLRDQIRRAEALNDQ